jgi:hypothetical protein
LSKADPRIRGQFLRGVNIQAAAYLVPRSALTAVRSGSGGIVAPEPPHRRQSGTAGDIGSEPSTGDSMQTRIEPGPFVRTLQRTCALFIAVLLAACATAPTGPSPQSLLKSAGFKPIVASTDKQIAHLPTLPAGEVTVIEQTGKSYYVYPDAANNQLYVGTAKEYQAYLKLRADNHMSAPNPEASYFKQDEAMRKADNRDASAPWWEAWPAFGGLGW